LPYSYKPPLEKTELYRPTPLIKRYSETAYQSAVLKSSFWLTIRARNERKRERAGIKTAAYMYACADFNFRPDETDGHYGRESSQKNLLSLCFS
jgi:hypothetical protein